MSRLLRVEMPQRTRIWILLMAFAGLRGLEVSATSPDHLSGLILTLPKTKGGSRGWVALPEWVADELRAAEPWEASPATIRRDIRAVMRQAGISATAHALRHTFGTELLRSSGNLRIVQSAMRHKAITSTAIYTAVASDEVAAAVDLLPRPL
jgi:integrase/recombinase XerD